MTTSILLRSPSPSPSPASTPLPALQSDLSSSSSSSASGSCLDLHRSSSAPSTRRIRFAPLPEPRRDLLFEPHVSSLDDPQLDGKSPPQTLSPPSDLPDSVVVLSPSVSPVSSLSSARSTPTIRISSDSPSRNSRKSSSKLLRPFSFLRRLSSPGQSPLSQTVSLPGSANISSLASSTASLPNSPSSLSARLPRFSTEDILTLGTKSLFRSRSGSSSASRPPRTSSPPRSLDPSKSLHRSASTGSGQGMKLGSGRRDSGEGSSQSHSATAIAGSGPKKRRASSSAHSPGAGGGRHTFVKVAPDVSRPSTAPSSPAAFPKRHVKMLNGRVYGAKRIAAQTLANPFANVRDEPEFVEWGYGGMGSVHASAGIANDMWKGLQRSERGGALFAGSSFDSSPSESARPSAGAVGGGRGSGAHAISPVARRKMSDDVPECGMGNVGAAGDDDDGSGMGWVKRRRAEREGKARLEQASKEQPLEGRKSGDSMYASTVSTACTSVASTGITTPATSPLASRSPSLADLKLTSSPVEPRDLHAATGGQTGEHPQRSESSAPPASFLKEDREHHILRAVRLSPNNSDLSRKRGHTAIYGRSPSLSRSLSRIDKDSDNGSPDHVLLSPVDTEETTASTSSLDDEEPNRDSDDGEADDDEEVVQDTGRKTSLGAGVEKISRHVDIAVR